MANLFSMHYTLQKLLPLDSQNTIEGGKGTSKSTLLNLYVVKYLSEGKIVFLNYDLAGWWPDLIARIHFGKNYGKKSPDELRQYYIDVMSRAWRFDDWYDLYDIRPKRNKGLSPEGQYLIGFDEGSMRMNSRDYASRMKYNLEHFGSANRESSFFSMLRKLGFHAIVCAQSIKDLDAQWRNQRGYILRSKNLKKEGVYGFRSPITFFRTNVFSGTGREGKFWWNFPSWLAPYYDSYALFDERDHGGLRYQYDPYSPFRRAREEQLALHSVTIPHLLPGRREHIGGGEVVAGREGRAAQHGLSPLDGEREPSHEALPDFS